MWNIGLESGHALLAALKTPSYPTRKHATDGLAYAARDLLLHRRSLVGLIIFKKTAMAESVPTNPYAGQKPGTSGLRKKTKEFMQVKNHEAPRISLNIREKRRILATGDE
jgi:hypothetical protein